MAKARQHAFPAVGSLDEKLDELPAQAAQNIITTNEGDRDEVYAFIQDCVKVANKVKRRAHIALALEVAHIKGLAAPAAQDQMNILRTAMGNAAPAADAAAADDEDEYTLLINLCNGATPANPALNSVLTRYYLQHPAQHNIRLHTAYRPGIVPSYLFQAMGNAMAVEYHRYFHDSDAGTPSKLPLPPIRDGFISLTELELVQMLLGLPRAQVLNSGNSRYRFQTTTMTPEQMRAHLQLPEGVPYQQPLQGPVRYVLRGSFRTNGVQLQLGAINTRVKASKKYAVGPNRHQPTMNMMHDPGEGHTAYHVAFSSYFVQKARSLDYLVVGINEFYTSKWCPSCKREGIADNDFVDIVTMRRLFYT
ncbi:MAG: hypothetical protein J3Q66DRAFT_424180 [Benniella sp.]|nr:MAG: hypothetical protein J3Q66DRAFT_424180 [Benniella sp.]